MEMSRRGALELGMETGEWRGGGVFAGVVSGTANSIWSDVGRFFARAVGASSEWVPC